MSVDHSRGARRARACIATRGRYQRCAAGADADATRDPNTNLLLFILGAQCSGRATDYCVCIVGNHAACVARVSRFAVCNAAATLRATLQRSMSGRGARHVLGAARTTARRTTLETRSSHGEFSDSRGALSGRLSSPLPTGGLAMNTNATRITNAADARFLPSPRRPRRASNAGDRARLSLIAMRNWRSLSPASSRFRPGRAHRRRCVLFAVSISSGPSRWPSRRSPMSAAAR